MKYPITPEYLASCPDGLVSLFEWLEEYIIKAICEQLNTTGEANATTLELIRQLQRGGMSLKAVEDKIKSVLRVSDAELDRILDDAVQRNNAYYNTAYDKAGLLMEEAQVEQFAADIEAIRAQTHDAMRNITQSMGFGMRGIDGSVTICDAQQTYQTILDKAAVKVMTGTESYNEAIRDGVREMANSGLIGDWVEYRDENGEVYHRNRVDVAVRRAVMTGVTQVSSKYTEQAAEDFDTPYREVSAHSGARDKGVGWQNHKSWQGKVYSTRAGDKYPSIYAVCGWGEVDGLEGANCRHMHFPWIEGISERTYTDEELANIDKPPFEYEGKKYTAYEATQQQRKLERAIRNVKRRLTAFKASGDKDAYNAAAVRYRRLKEAYKSFSDAAGLKTKDDRTYVEGFGAKEAREAMKAG